MNTGIAKAKKSNNKVDVIKELFPDIAPTLLDGTGLSVQASRINSLVHILVSFKGHPFIKDKSTPKKQN